jgi:hypothetical protein
MFGPCTRKCDLTGKMQKCHDNANLTGECNFKRENANIKKCANLIGQMQI